MINKIKRIADNFSIDKVVKVSKFGNGLINETFLVKSRSGEYVLQKLHPIFKSTVLTDTQNVTLHLSGKGLLTPLIVKTKNKKLFLKDDKKGCWRMLTFIPGKCYEKGIDSKKAFSAGQFVGRFHDALSGFDYEFKHKIKGFRSPKARIYKLKKTLNKFKNTQKYRELHDLSMEVLENYKKIKNKEYGLPDRIVHGDLKINNIRFDEKEKAVCLLDLDTLGRGKIATDIADAARTWCNKADEGDVKNSKFDLKIFENMMRGYLDTAKFATRGEIKQIPEAIQKVILVLSTRFLTDAFEEKYFRLNSEQYKNLYEQNKTKSFAQMVLYRDFLKKKESVDKIIKNLF